MSMIKFVLGAALLTVPAVAIDCAESRMTSIENINKDCDGEYIPFPTGFGNLLLLPFGLDIEQAKEFGKGLFKRRFMEVYEMSGVTGDGQYRYMPNHRCRTEKRGVHPIGGKGLPWTLAIWNEAQEWCSEPENSCSGIMQFVGRNATENCHHWCGTPQFCEEEQEEEEDGEVMEPRDYLFSEVYDFTRPRPRAAVRTTPAPVFIVKQTLSNMGDDEEVVGPRDTEVPDEDVGEDAPRPRSVTRIVSEADVTMIPGKNPENNGDDGDRGKDLRRMDTPSVVLPDQGKQAIVARKKQAESDAGPLMLSCVKRLDRLLKIDLMGVDARGEPDRPIVRPSSSDPPSSGAAGQPGGSPRPGSAESLIPLPPVREDAPSIVVAPAVDPGESGGRSTGGEITEKEATTIGREIASEEPPPKGGAEAQQAAPAASGDVSLTLVKPQGEIRPSSADTDKASEHGFETVLWQDWLDDLGFHVEWGIAELLMGHDFLMTQDETLLKLEQNHFADAQDLAVLYRVWHNGGNELLYDSLCGVVKVARTFFHALREVLVQQCGDFKTILRKFDVSGDRWIDLEEFTELANTFFFPWHEKGLGFVMGEADEDVQRALLREIFALFVGSRKVDDVKLRVDKFAAGLAMVNETQLFTFRIGILRHYHSFVQAFGDMKESQKIGGTIVEYIPKERLLQEYVTVAKRHHDHSVAHAPSSTSSEAHARESRLLREAERFYEYVASFALYHADLPHGIHGISYEDFLTAMAMVAPGIEMPQFRKRLLLKYGNWKNAFAVAEAMSNSEGDFSMAEWELFEIFGTKLDFNRADSVALFKMLDTDNSGDVSYDEFKEHLMENGLGFGLEEFAIRLWTGREKAGQTISQIFERLSIEHDKPLIITEFAAELFGVYLTPEIEERFSKKSYLSARRNLLPVIPKLSAMETQLLYDEVRRKSHKVNLNTLLSALGSHVSDILCTHDEKFFPGQTATISYRIPKDKVAECQKKPFISVVLSDVKWTQAGGGGWQLRGQNISELSKAVASLPNFPRVLQGTVTLQVPFPQDPTER